MLKLRFLITVLLGFQFFIFGANAQNCLPLDHYKEKSWYNPLLVLLQQEYCIDSLNAKLLIGQSALRPARSIQETITDHGKITHDKVFNICSINEKDSLVFVFTHEARFCNLFLFYPGTGKLTRVKNEELISVIPSDGLELNIFHETSFVFYPKIRETPDWENYLNYDSKTNTLSQINELNKIQGK